LRRKGEKRKDGLEVLTKLIVSGLVVIVLVTPPSFLALSHLRLLRYVGAGLVTSLPGKLVFGLFWAYFFSIDGSLMVFSFLILLLFIDSISKWLSEMAW
jgi:hypothetical protein